MRAAFAVAKLRMTTCQWTLDNALVRRGAKSSASFLFKEDCQIPALYADRWSGGGLLPRTVLAGKRYKGNTGDPSGYYLFALTLDFPQHLIGPRRTYGNNHAPAVSHWSNRG